MEKANHDLSQTLISSPLFIIYANHCDLLHFFECASLVHICICFRAFISSTYTCNYWHSSVTSEKLLLIL